MNACLVDLEIFESESGETIVFDKNFQPFVIKRTFIMRGMPNNSIRGKHSNKVSKMVLVPLLGSCDVKVLGASGQAQIYNLNSLQKGLFIDSNIWREMYNFSDDCILFVASDSEYDASEYVNNLEEFLTNQAGDL